MNFFSLKLHNTTIQKEVLSGVSTFIAMSYILSVNPMILSRAGMDAGGVFIATVLSIIVTTAVSAFYTKMPLVYAPSLSLNMMFVPMATKICGGDYKMVLLATYLSGIVIVGIVITGAYEQIIIQMPVFVKHSMIAGIGVMLLREGANILQLFSKNFDGRPECEIISKEAAFCVFAIVLALFLKKKKVRGAIGIGIFITYLLAAISEVAAYMKTPGNGLKTFLDTYISQRAPIASIVEVAYQFPHAEELVNDRAKLINLIMLVFTITLIHFFDAFGTASVQLDRIQSEDANLDPNARKKTMLMNGIGSILSGCIGTSSVTTYAENMIGIDAGAKTGLSAIIVCICCGFSLFISPIFTTMPAYIVASVMIYIGLTFLANVKCLKHMRISEWIAFLFIAAYTGITFQIGEAVTFGIFINILIKRMTGRKKEISNYWMVIMALSIVCIAIRVANQ